MTEQLHFFVGGYTNESKTSAGGGDFAEDEDNEVLKMSIDDALAGIASGVIEDGKTIMLLQYAALNLFNGKQKSS